MDSGYKRLPKVQAAMAQSGPFRDLEASERRRMEEIPVANRTILVIDDDPPILAMVRDILEEEGFAISTAGNGKEGLNHITRARPDLILCDERMPGLAGHEVCARLYADPASQHIPVIIMSAHSDELAPTPPNCLLFLRKPFQYADLIHAIDDILGADDHRPDS